MAGEEAFTAAKIAVKQLNPKLNLSVREFRSTPAGFCDEEIVLG